MLATDEQHDCRSCHFFGIVMLIWSQAVQSAGFYAERVSPGRVNLNHRTDRADLHEHGLGGVVGQIYRTTSERVPRASTYNPANGRSPVRSWRRAV